MKRRFFFNFFLLPAVLGVLSVSSASAQCDNGRYTQFIFNNVDTTNNILYGGNYNYDGTYQDLHLDVYRPQNDTATHRALIIFVHGGSFVAGSKDGPDMVPLCRDFAKMGYVTASIEYRLGVQIAPLPDSVDVTEAVWRAVHDARAAVRFFRKDFSENGNTYGIDTSKIFMGGVSAGAITAIHLAYMDHMSEVPAYVDTTMAGLGGGVPGNSGNPGYSSKVKAIVNISGAIGDTTWMQPGDNPILSLHGDSDTVVPYGSDELYFLGFIPLLHVYGSSIIDQRAEHIGIEHCFKPFPGAGHTPEVGNAAYYDTTLTYMRNWLDHFLCPDAPLLCTYNGSVTGLAHHKVEVSDIRVWPNPSSGDVWIDNPGLNGQQLIKVYDVTGRLLRQEKRNFQPSVDQRLSNLPKGWLIIEIENAKSVYRTRVLIE